MAANSIAKGRLVLIRARVASVFPTQNIAVVRPVPLGPWQGDPLLTLPVTVPLSAIADVIEDEPETPRSPQGA